MHILAEITCWQRSSYWGVWKAREWVKTHFWTWQIFEVQPNAANGKFCPADFTPNSVCCSFPCLSFPGANLMSIPRDAQCHRFASISLGSGFPLAGVRQIDASQELQPWIFHPSKEIWAPLWFVLLKHTSRHPSGKTLRAIMELWLAWWITELYRC